MDKYFIKAFFYTIGEIFSLLWNKEKRKEMNEDFKQYRKEHPTKEELLNEFQNKAKLAHEQILEIIGNDDGKRAQFMNVTSILWSIWNRKIDKTL